MRYGPDDKFWVVVDPKPRSTLEDLVFEASLRDLELQFGVVARQGHDVEAEHAAGDRQRRTGPDRARYRSGKISDPSAPDWMPHQGARRRRIGSHRRNGGQRRAHADR